MSQYENDPVGGISTPLGLLIGIGAGSFIGSLFGVLVIGFGLGVPVGIAIAEYSQYRYRQKHSA